MRRGAKLVVLLLLAALLAACGREAGVSGASGGEAGTPEPVPGVTLSPIPVETEANPTMRTLTASALAARMAGDPDAVCLFAVNVGKGDALILRSGDALALVDTGKAWAAGRVRRALSVMGADALALDGVFVTHTDEDHAGGLRCSRTRTTTTRW